MQKEKSGIVNLKAGKDGVLHVPIENIEVEIGFNVRKDTAPDAELIMSIEANGMIHPIHLRWKDKKKDTFYVIDGERRLAAATPAGLGSVPVINHGFLEDTQALIIALTANENQKRLSKKEQLDGFKRLKKQGLSDDAISRVMAVNKRTVVEMLRVEKGTKKLKTATMKNVEIESIPPRVAARAAQLPVEEQEEILPKITGKPTETGLQEVRKTEKKLNLKRPGQKVEPYSLAENAPLRCKVIEEKIRRRLLHAPAHKVLIGQLRVIECVKGTIDIEDLFGLETAVVEKGN